MPAENRQRVAEGQWQLASGWWVEPDVNMPNGESLALLAWQIPTEDP